VAIDLGYGMVTNSSDSNLGQLVAAARFGYYQSRRLTFVALMTYLNTIGGLEWASDDPTVPTAHGPASSVAFENPATAARAALIGLGLDWGLSDRVGVHANINTTIWGENVEDALIIEAGLGWAFRLFGKSGAPGGPPPTEN